MRVLICIPAWNESATLAAVVACARQTGHAVLVIDDGSTDGTAAIARAAGAAVARHPCNLGLVAALQTGYQYALEQGYDAVVQVDGDGQHAPGDIPAVLAPLTDNTADLVIGSRFLGTGAYVMPPLRRAGRNVLRWMLRRAGLTVSDPTSGFRAMRAGVLRVFTSPGFPEDNPDAGALLLAARHGFRIREVGVSMHPRVAGAGLFGGVLRPLIYLPCEILSFAMIALRARPGRAGQPQSAPE